MIKIKEGGYRPKNGLFLANALTQLPLTNIDALDIGTGETGLFAYCIKARGAAKVIGSDIDEMAIAHVRTACTLGNQIQWLTSNIYSDIKQCEFDLIVSNPPQMPMQTKSNSHDYGGPDGRTIITGILQGARKFLKAEGKVLMLTFDFLGTLEQTNAQPSLAEIGTQYGFNCQLLTSITREVRINGATEKNLTWISQVYPKYHFKRSNRGNPTFNLQILAFS